MPFHIGRYECLRALSCVLVALALLSTLTQTALFTDPLPNLVPKGGFEEGLSGWGSVWTGGPNVGQVSVDLEQPDYIVFIEGTTYKALNAATGAVTSNANFVTLLNAIIASGTTILVKAGTYSCSAPIVDGGASNVTLKGEGMYATKFDYTQAVRGIELTSCSGWRIEGIELDLNDYALNALYALYLNSVTDTVIRDCYIHNVAHVSSGSTGIFVYNSQRITIDHCRLEQCDHAAIQLHYDTTDVMIKDCYAENNANGAVDKSAHYVVYGTDGHRVQRVQFNNCTGRTSGLMGIQPYRYCDNVSVIGGYFSDSGDTNVCFGHPSYTNTCTNLVASGVTISGTGTGIAVSNRIAISGCTVEQSSATGIVLYSGAEYSTVIGNSVSVSSNRGMTIYASYCTVTQNNFYGVSDATRAIVCESGATHNLIEGNNLYNWEVGIRFESGANYNKVGPNTFGSIIFFNIQDFGTGNEKSTTSATTSSTSSSMTATSYLTTSTSVVTSQFSTTSTMATGTSTTYQTTTSGTTTSVTTTPGTSRTTTSSEINTLTSDYTTQQTTTAVSTTSSFASTTSQTTTLTQSSETTVTSGSTTPITSSTTTSSTSTGYTSSVLTTQQSTTTTMSTLLTTSTTTRTFSSMTTTSTFTTPTTITSSTSKASGKGTCRLILDASPKTGLANKPVTISGTLYGSWNRIKDGVVVGNQIEISTSWGFKTVVTTDNHGRFSTSTNCPSMGGTYVITATSYEDQDLAGCSATITYQVSAATNVAVTTTTVATIPVTTKTTTTQRIATTITIAKSGTTFYGRLTDAYGNPLGNKPLTIYYEDEGRLCSRSLLTDDNGNWSFSIGGVDSARITFAGDIHYLPCKAAYG